MTEKRYTLAGEFASLVDAEGRVTTCQTVYGQTLDAIYEAARVKLREFFAHHGFEIVAVTARPIQTVGGEVVHWEADVEARMGEVAVLMDAER